MSNIKHAGHIDADEIARLCMSTCDCNNRTQTTHEYNTINGGGEIIMTIIQASILISFIASIATRGTITVRGSSENMYMIR